MLRSIGIALAILSAVATAAAQETDAAPGGNPTATTPAPARVGGYIRAGAMPSSAALVPAPPAPGSPAMARDEDVSRSALAMHGSARWDLAAKDAILTFPQVAQTFSCALDLQIDEQRTPKLMMLLRRTLADAGRSTREAKVKYQRVRPFMANGKPMCTPERDEALRADGSYPSGHSAIGWALALVLAEVSPEQANAILARGRAFGQSRIVCNVHWQSDVLEGQMMGSAAVARMHAEPSFQADVEAARAELAAVRSQAQTQARDCKLETQTLESWR